MAAGGGVEPCVGAGELEPCAVFLLEGEAGEEIAEAGDGKGFAGGILIAEGIELEGVALVARGDGDFEACGFGKTCGR